MLRMVAALNGPGGPPKPKTISLLGKMYGAGMRGGRRAPPATVRVFLSLKAEPVLTYDNP